MEQKTTQACWCEWTGEACRSAPEGSTQSGTDRIEGLRIPYVNISLNRRMRTRLSGGVGGGAGDDSSYPIALSRPQGLALCYSSAPQGLIVYTPYTNAGRQPASL